MVEQVSAQTLTVFVAVDHLIAATHIMCCLNSFDAKLSRFTEMSLIFDRFKSRTLLK